jgi:hypothetical protein
MEHPAPRQSKPAARKTRSSLGLGLHLLGAGDDHRVDAVGHLAALDHPRRGAQVADARVGAGADEHPLERDVLDRGAGLERHVGKRALGRLAVGGRVEVLGGGHASRDRRHHPGVRAPGHLGRELVGAHHQLAVKRCLGVGAQRAPALDRLI